MKKIEKGWNTIETIEWPGSLKETLTMLTEGGIRPEHISVIQDCGVIIYYNPPYGNIDTSIPYSVEKLVGHLGKRVYLKLDKDSTIKIKNPVILTAVHSNGTVECNELGESEGLIVDAEDVFPIDPKDDKTLTPREFFIEKAKRVANVVDVKYSVTVENGTDIIETFTTILKNIEEYDSRKETLSIIYALEMVTSDRWPSRRLHFETSFES